MSGTENGGAESADEWVFYYIAARQDGADGMIYS